MNNYLTIKQLLLNHVGRNSTCRTEFFQYFHDKKFMNRGEFFLKSINNISTYHDFFTKGKELMILSSCQLFSNIVLSVRHGVFRPTDFC